MARAMPQAMERSFATPMMRPRFPPSVCRWGHLRGARLTWVRETGCCDLVAVAVVAHPRSPGKGSGRPAHRVILAPGDFRHAQQRRRPRFAHFEAWMAEAAKSEPNDPNAVCLATCTPEGSALRPHGAAEGRRSSRNSSSTPTWIAGRAASCWPTPSPRSASTGRPCRAASASRGRRSAAQPGRGGCLLRLPRPRLAHRRLGQPAVPPAGGPLRAGEGGRRIHHEIRHRRDSPAGILVRLPACCRSGSSSGATCPSACTTGRCFIGSPEAARVMRPRAGGWRRCIRDASRRRRPRPRRCCAAWPAPIRSRRISPPSSSGRTRPGS